MLTLSHEHHESKFPSLLPFGFRYMQPAPVQSEASRGTNATSKQTTQDGEEEADTDWNDQNDDC